MRTDIRSLFKRRGTWLGIGLGVAFLLQATAGLAGPKDFAVYSTRLGGDASTAQPYIDKLATQLEKDLGWPKGSAKGQFFASKKEVVAGLDQQKPGFAFVEPQLYLELASSHKLELVAGVESAELNTTKLNVVVKDPAYKSLADLKGKKVWTTLADWPRYLNNVVFGGKAPTLELKQIGAVTKGARAVLRGEADATLLDDQQLAEMQKLEGGAALRAISPSRKLPTLLVVSFGAALSAGDRKSLAGALLKMCGTKDGGEVCKEMRITKFVPLDLPTINSAKEAFDKP